MARKKYEVQKNKTIEEIVEKNLDLFTRPIHPVIQDLYNKSWGPAGIVFIPDLLGNPSPDDDCSTFRCFIDWSLISLQFVNYYFYQLKSALDDLAMYYYMMEADYDIERDVFLGFGKAPRFSHFEDPGVILEVWRKYIQVFAEHRTDPMVKDPVDEVTGELDLSSIPNFLPRLENKIAAKELTMLAYEYCRVSAQAKAGYLLPLKSLEERMARAFVINKIGKSVRHIDLIDLYKKDIDLLDYKSGVSFVSESDFEQFLSALEDDPNFCPNAQMGYMMLLSRICRSHYGDLWKQLNSNKTAFLSKVDEALNTLPPLERDILIKRFGLNGERRLSYDEIGKLKEYRINGETICYAAGLSLMRLSSEEYWDIFKEYMHIEVVSSKHLRDVIDFFKKNLL